MSGITAASLYANVSVTGGAATSSALRGVGGEVTNAQRALSAFGGVGTAASKGLGLLERGAGGVGSAFTHLKGTVGGLIAGPLGFLGLGAGVLGLAGALKSGIDTANTMALSIEKLTGLTGEDAAAMSGLIAVTGKFGISTDQLSTIVGFETKTLGKLAETTVAAAKGTVPLAKAQDDVRLASEKLKVAQEKLIETENKKKVSASQLTAAHNAVTDATAKLVKAQAELTTSTGNTLPPGNKLVALQKLYGVTLTDSKGAALDFSTVLNNVSDYYNSNATAGQKAALAATIFGRGYAVMIPVLKLGSEGFAKAQQAAVALGLTLTDSNANDLLKYQETMRNLGDAVGGLQLQLSLQLVPAIEDVATAATGFIANNRAGILTFFSTLIVDARTAAGFLTGTVIPDLQSLAGAATGFWNQIPPQLRDILVKGFIADRAMKFLFGFDPATAIGSIIAKQLLGGLSAGIGAVFGKVVSTVGGTAASKLAPQDVFVVNMPPGGLGGGVPGAAAGEAAGGGGVVAEGAALGLGGVALIGAAFAAILAAPAYLSWAGANHILGSSTGGPNRGAATAGTHPADYYTNGGASSQGMVDAVNKNSASIAANAGMIAAVNKNSASIASANAARINASLLAQRAAFGQDSLRLQAAMTHLSGLTTAQTATLVGSQRLQMFAANANAKLTWGQLNHASTVAHMDHLGVLGRADHLTVAQEQTKLAIQAGNTLARAQEARLAKIQSSEALQASKDTSLSLTTNFVVSGASVAQAIVRLKSGVRVT